MEAEAAKLIGAGLASIALVGAGIGIGTIFGSYLQGALRNPSAAPSQFANLLLGFALAEKDATMPQLNPLDWAPQLIWLLLTFGILYLLMVFVALPRIGAVIDKRAAHIASDLASADKLRRETEEAIAAYEQALAEAKQKAHAIIDEGRAKLKKETAAERAKLEKELAARSAEAEARIEKAKASAMKEVSAVAVDVASDIVRNLIGTAPAKRDIENAVNAARKA